MVKNGQFFEAADGLPEVSFARREGSAFGVEVLSLGELRGRLLDHSLFRPHRIGFHILVVITGGHGWHMVDFVQHPVERGSVVHIAPGQVQRYDGETEPLGFLVLFEPEVCQVEGPHGLWPPSFRLADGDFEVLESLVQILLDLKTRPLNTSPDRLAWRMLAAVLELCTDAVTQHLNQEGTPRSPVFEAFDALLEEDLTQHRDLPWYARQLGYSEKTLSRWCQRIVGVSAKVYLDRRVALEAKRLLVHTDHKVEAIARTLGFSEATNFVKFFKRLEGTTPSRFRGRYL